MRKSSAGSWVITGRIAPDAGVCADTAARRGSQLRLRVHPQLTDAGAVVQEEWQRARNGPPTAPSRSPATPRPSADAVAVQRGSAVVTPGIGLLHARHELELCRAAQARSTIAMGPGDGGQGDLSRRTRADLRWLGHDRTTAHRAVCVCAQFQRAVSTTSPSWEPTTSVCDFDISGKTVVVASANRLRLRSGRGHRCTSCRPH